MKQIQLFTLLVSGLNLSIHCNQSKTSLQQREQAVKDFIRQEIEKGTPLEMIQHELVTQSLNTSEYEAFVRTRAICKNILEQARKENCSIPSHCRQGVSFAKTTNCQQLQKYYKIAFDEWTKYSNSYKNTPENQAIKMLKDDINIENRIPILEKEKQNGKF